MRTYLREPVQGEGGGEHVDGSLREQTVVERARHGGGEVAPPTAVAGGSGMRREEAEEGVEVVAREVGEVEAELRIGRGGVDMLAATQLVGHVMHDRIGDDERAAAAGAAEVGRRQEKLPRPVGRDRDLVQCLLQGIQHHLQVSQLHFVASFARSSTGKELAYL